MGTLLANLIGAYLLAGVVLYGFGSIARNQWIASGKMDPPKGRRSKLYTRIGVAIGFLFWPIFLVGIPLWRWSNRRKATRYLGFCEHATGLDPICGPCSREAEIDPAEEALRRRLSEISANENAELRKAQSCYYCVSCVRKFEGFPPATTSTGMPLCESCRRRS